MAGGWINLDEVGTFVILSHSDNRCKVRVRLIRRNDADKMNCQ